MADASQIPELRLYPEMIERAGKALAGNTPELFEDDIPILAEAVLRAAFEDVPLRAYAADLLLQGQRTMVIVLGGANAGKVIERDPGDPDGLLELGHHTDMTFKNNRIDRVVVSDLAAGRKELGA